MATLSLRLPLLWHGRHVLAQLRIAAAVHASLTCW